MEKLKRIKKGIVPFVFIWIGFVGAISFMEAWMKFQAPGITLELGLGIGRLVFTALNRVEIVCALIILSFAFWAQRQGFRGFSSFWIFVPITILLLDTFWLLPALAERAGVIISGESVPKSYLHMTYGILEVIKIIFLFSYGMKSLNRATDA